MKRFISGAILIVCFCVLGFAQTEEVELLPCPDIQVEGPAEAVKAGETMTFMAVVDSERQKYDFEWQVSAGQIVSANDQAELKVATTPDLAGTNITATLKITDLPDYCSREASGIGFIEQIRVSSLIKIDEYGTLPLRDEYARFKTLFTEYLQEPGTKAYVHFEISRSEKNSDIKTRLESIFNFLSENKFDRNWLIIDVCRSDVNKTVFQIIPNGAEYPDNEGCEKVYIDFSEQQ